MFKTITTLAIAMATVCHLAAQTAFRAGPMLEREASFYHDWIYSCGVISLEHNFRPHLSFALGLQGGYAEDKMYNSNPLYLSQLQANAELHYYLKSDMKGFFIGPAFHFGAVGIDDNEKDFHYDSPRIGTLATLGYVFKLGQKIDLALQAHGGVTIIENYIPMGVKLQLGYRFQG